MTVKTHIEAAPATANGQRRYHGDHERTIAMKIEEERQQLTQSEQNVLAQDRERWARMGAGCHLDDWLAYAAGLMLRRRMAMHMAFVNTPEGKGYAKAFCALMEADGLHTMDKQSISAVLWLNDNPEHVTILREIRETMTVGERSRLNSPISARQRVEKVLKARNGGTEASVRTSPLARQAAVVNEQARDIEHLKERLAAAEARDGSLFDLRKDSIKDIAATIIANVTPGRAEGIAREILHQFKSKKTPAG
jgi:hypothetical protein